VNAYKNYNAFDYTHKQIFKTLMRNNLDGVGPLNWGALYIRTLCTFLRPPLSSGITGLHIKVQSIVEKAICLLQVYAHQAASENYHAL